MKLQTPNATMNETSNFKLQNPEKLQNPSSKRSFPRGLNLLALSDTKALRRAQLGAMRQRNLGGGGTPPSRWRCPAGFRPFRPFRPLSGETSTSATIRETCSCMGALEV